MNNDNLTPFERMVKAVRDAGYTELEELIDGDTHGFLYHRRNGKVTFYIGEPTGTEYYWKLDGKIAVDNAKAFNKWSQVPFYVWLPENEDEKNRIMAAIEFLATEEGYQLSNDFGECNEKFGFETPKKR